jgi:hypothetical protein
VTLDLTLSCPTAPGRLAIRDGWFDLFGEHYRTIARVETAAGVHEAVFLPDAREVTIDVGAPPSASRGGFFRWVVSFSLRPGARVRFASTLAALDLPRKNLALALLGFNLGVEVGQALVVALRLPLLIWIHHCNGNRRCVRAARSRSPQSGSPGSLSVSSCSVGDVRGARAGPTALAGSSPLPGSPDGAVLEQGITAQAMPAAFAASSPLRESSTTRHAWGDTRSCLAVSTNTSGAGLPRVTWVPDTITSKKRSSRSALTFSAITTRSADEASAMR